MISFDLKVSLILSNSSVSFSSLFHYFCFLSTICSMPHWHINKIPLFFFLVASNLVSRTFFWWVNHCISLINTSINIFPQCYICSNNCFGLVIDPCINVSKVSILELSLAPYLLYACYFLTFSFCLFYYFFTLVLVNSSYTSIVY